MKETITKHVLHNAWQFGGTVNPKVVLGMVLREKPELRQNVPLVLNEIGLITKQVEKLPSEEIKKRLQVCAPELLQEKKEQPEGPLKPLPNAQQGKVVLRIAPSPSGPLHVGHAYGLSLNYEYAKMYGGKLFLRIEDTNPENIYAPAYQLIEEDAQWLTDGGIAKVIVQSSRLGTYYDYAEQLVEKGKAYVCTCNPDLWRSMKNEGKACACRSLAQKEQTLRYAQMFNSYAEGEAVLRLKTDIQHKNPAMRDFAIMRVNEHVHPKTGKTQRVWPLMVFSVAVDDHDFGVTHVLNGKDHMDNAAKERLIMDYFGWSHPEYRHWGRINFEGMPLSSSQMRIAIEQKEFQGWDDIRLPFLPALRKRGFQPGAFRRFAIEMGLSQNDKTVTREEFWKMMDAFNREIVEPMANRYFFVDKPVKVAIAGLPLKKETALLHPDFPERGTREFTISGNFFISKLDFQRLAEGLLHRLMDCCNFVVEENAFRYISDIYEDYKNSSHKGKIIHWVPVEKALKVEVVLDKGTVITGWGEEAVACLKEGTIIQFERRYFARSQGKNRFYYLHK